MANKKSLDSLYLSDGGNAEVGLKVSLLAPESLKDPTEMRAQERMNEILCNKLGKPPYKVIEIYQQGIRSMMKVKGKTGKSEEVTADYFGCKGLN